MHYALCERLCSGLKVLDIEHVAHEFKQSRDLAGIIFLALFSFRSHCKIATIPQSAKY
jgi:hypothetical protein